MAVSSFVQGSLQPGGKSRREILLFSTLCGQTTALIEQASWRHQWYVIATPRVHCCCARLRLTPRCLPIARLIRFSVWHCCRTANSVSSRSDRAITTSHTGRRMRPVKLRHPCPATRKRTPQNPTPMRPSTRTPILSAASSPAPSMLNCAAVPRPAWGLHASSWVDPVTSTRHGGRRTSYRSRRQKMRQSLSPHPMTGRFTKRPTSGPRSATHRSVEAAQWLLHHLHPVAEAEAQAAQ